MAFIIPALPFKKVEPDRLGLLNLLYSTMPQQYGFIPNPAGFSAPAGLDKYEGNIKSQIIKLPDTPYVISEEFRQFIPTIRRIIEIEQAKEKPIEGVVRLNVFQGIVMPRSDTEEAYWLPHRDIELDPIMAGGTAADSHNYVVYDSLPTGFAECAIKEDDIEKIKSAEDRFMAQSAALERRVTGYANFASYQIIGFDALATHAIQNAREPTPRTFLGMAFMNAHQTFVDPNKTENSDLDHFRQQNSALITNDIG